MKKKHELISEATKRFPKGSTIKSDYCNETFDSSGVFIFWGNSLMMEKDERTHFTVYELDLNKWAELVEKKEPLLVSEDGVELFEGDEFWHVINFNNRTELGIKNPIKLNDAELKVALSNLDENKIFSTREAAEKWISEQKKPKEIEVKMSVFKENYALVRKDGVHLMSETSLRFCLSKEDLENIYNTYKSLSC